MSDTIRTVSRFPVLEELLGDQLFAMERVMRRGREGKHYADDIVSHGADHHLVKSDSHVLQSGVCFDSIDRDTDEPHILLAAIRLMMADRCVREGT